MSRKHKLIEKIKNSPQKIRFDEVGFDKAAERIYQFDEVDSLLVSIGFIRRQPNSGSSHFTYILGELITTIPYKRPYVKEKYIKDIIELIDKLGY